MQKRGGWFIGSGLVMATFDGSTVTAATASICRPAATSTVRVTPRVGPVYSLIMFASAIVGLFAGLIGLALLVVGLIWRNRATPGAPPTPSAAPYPVGTSVGTVADHG